MASGDSTSLYRRHRPGSFDEVVGQQHVVRTLRNAVEGDQVHHAYLFVGSRGTGKTSMAKILARSLNCERGGPTVTPCGECESCLTIAAGTSVDVIEMDAASNRSVDDIRDLRERVAYAPAGGHWKVYILDEAHMLTKEAWNAFLKTLEEPPPRTAFVLATTEAHKVMPTIADRCQRFDFQRPSLEQVSTVLERVAAAEGIEIEAGAVAMIARSAQGSFRDALGTLDQLVVYGGGRVDLDIVLEVLGVADAELLFNAVDAVIAEDPGAVLRAVEGVAASGRDPSQFARDMLGHLRHLLVTQTIGEVPNTFVVTAADRDRMAAQANSIGAATLVRTIDELAAALAAVREGDEARMAVEIALLKAARPDLDPGVEGLLRRIERLEERLAGGEGSTPELRGAGPVAGQASSSSPAAAGEEPDPAPPAPGSEEVDDAPPPSRPESPQAQAASGPPPDEVSSPKAGSSPSQGPEASQAQATAPPPQAPESPQAQPTAPPPQAPEPSPPQANEPKAVDQAPGASEQADPASDAPPSAPAAGGGGEDLSPAAAGEDESPSPPAGPAAHSTPEPSATELSLDDLTRVWPAVLDNLLQTAPALAATFEGARPVSVDADGLTISFSADATFNKRKAEAPDKRDQLTVAVEAVTGIALRPQFVLNDSEDAGADPKPPPTAEPGDHSALVERLKNEFDAEEVG